MNESNELSNQLDEFEKGGSGYIFYSLTKIILKMFRYHVIRVSSSCKLPKRFCKSNSLVNLINRDKYCFLRSILALESAGYDYSAQNAHKKFNHPERKSQYKKYFPELNQGDIQFP